VSHSPLAILERAISDVGQWTWWTGDPANAVQLEFGGVQLWFAPIEQGQPPSGLVALRFPTPKAVVFMSRSDDPVLNSHDWPTRFQADELGAFTVGYDEFTLTDAEAAWSFMEDAKHTIDLVGVRPQKTDFDDRNAWISFWAGPIGMVVVATEMEIVTHHGIVGIEEIERLSERWWEYWREYWDKKDSDSPLAYDYACEVTIPAGPE
jgi:hypothetical protein